MARILAQGEHCTALLSEPDEDVGEHTWVANCGAASEEGRTDTMEDALMHMGMHVDSCPGTAPIGKHEVSL
jgi:hypothetical protein